MGRVPVMHGELMGTMNNHQPSPWGDQNKDNTVSLGGELGAVGGLDDSFEGERFTRGLGDEFDALSSQRGHSSAAHGLNTSTHSSGRIV